MTKTANYRQPMYSKSVVVMMLYISKNFTKSERIQEGDFLNV